MGSGLEYSWPDGRLWMGIQIDHVLTLGMKAGQFEVLDEVGSDHYPVRADLMM
jgi:endonuclease/exonuclease/phosphatase (EEP) superfamily protein YafD